MYVNSPGAGTDRPLDGGLQVKACVPEIKCTRVLLFFFCFFFY